MSKSKTQDEKAGSWVFRDIPRDLMHKMKIAAAVEHKSVKQLLIDLSRTHLEDLEKKGFLPKGKG
jgi:porphobilinogen deaminase